MAELATSKPRPEPWIELTVRSRSFRILWLRYVRGFDSAEHCARCLIGKRSSLVPFTRNIASIVVDAPMHEPFAAEFELAYLCGVTRSHARNLHLAMRRKPGTVANIDSADILARFHGWERLPIRPRATR